MKKSSRERNGKKKEGGRESWRERDGKEREGWRERERGSKSFEEHI